VKEIKFIDVGEGITEGHVRQWLVKDGDQVKEDQPVVRVETDKAVVNVPSPISGTIKQNAKEGTDVHLGDTIAFIGTPDELVSAVATTQQASQSQITVSEAPLAQAQTQPSQKTGQNETIATPAVRKLARDMNVDIVQVAGTGPEGRILDSDVRTASQKSQPKPAQKFSEILEEKHTGEIERVPMSTTRTS
jgi:pyruvate dehydrogenase E2 component (dihydrolipoamide acetyltransferase)